MESIKNLDAASHELHATKSAMNRAFERVYRLIDDPDRAPKPVQEQNPQSIMVKLTKKLPRRGLRLVEDGPQ